MSLSSAFKRVLKLQRLSASLLVLGGTAIAPVAAYAQSNYATPYTFTTLASHLNEPTGIAVDAAGDAFVSNQGDGTITMIAPNGGLTTIANTGTFSGRGIAVSSAGVLFVTDFGDNTVKRVTSTTSGGVTTWAVTTIAGTSGSAGSTDGVGAAARFNGPTGVAVDGAGRVYVSDSNNDTIRLLTPATSGGVTSWTVSTIAGVAGAGSFADGPGATAKFNSPYGAVLDHSGNLIVADANNNCIRMVTPTTTGGVTTWSVSTLAGPSGTAGSADGSGATATFRVPEGVAIGADGTLFISDTGNDEVRKLVASVSGGLTSWTVTTLAGTALNPGSTDGSGSAATFDGPIGVAVDAIGDVFVTDTSNSKVRWGALATPAFTSASTASVAYGTTFNYTATFAGSLAADISATGLPTGLFINSATGVISGEVTANRGDYVVTLSESNGAGAGTGTLTISVTGGGATPGAPTNLTVTPGDGNVTVSFTPPALDGGTPITYYEITATPLSGTPVVSGIALASPMVLNGLTNGTTYTVALVAGNSAGTGDVAVGAVPVTPEVALVYNQTNLPAGGNTTPLIGVTQDASGSVYCTAGNEILKFSNGTAQILAGSSAVGSADGAGSAASFNSPFGLATDAQGNVYVADTGNNSIRKISPSGMVSTLAGLVQGDLDGNGVAAKFNAPTAVAVDLQGDVFVADTGNNALREITPAGNVLTLLTTSGFTFADDPAYPPPTYSITGVTVDSNGTPYIGVTTTLIEGRSGIRSFAVGILKVTTLKSYTFIYQVPDQNGSFTPSPGDGTLTIDAKWNFYVMSGGDLYKGANKIASIPNAFGGQSGSVAISANSIGQIYVADYPFASVLVVSPVGSTPVISAEPVGGTIAYGSATTLSVTASGTPSPTYQWSVDGTAIPGATGSQYVTDVPGTYTVTVTNSASSVTSTPAVLVAANRLANISCRAFVGTGANVAIAGFIVSGPAGTTETVLIRGVGPALSEFAISGALAQPILTLFDAAGHQIATNAGWNTAPNAAAIAAATSTVNGFALPLDSADSAILTNLAPGSYTAQISGANTTTGVALAEVYEMAAGDPELINISTRAFVGTGANVAIAGIVVHGPQPAKVLIRAVGPTLGAFGVSGTLAAPSLNVVDSSGKTIASNIGWSTSTDATVIAAETKAIGAFALPSGSADSAVLVTLPPGSFTAIVSGVGNTTGVALVEAYQAP